MKYIKELNPEPPDSETLEGTPGFEPASELPEGLAAIFPNGINAEIAYQVMEMALNALADNDRDRLCRHVQENPAQCHAEFVLHSNALSRAGIPFAITRHDTGEELAVFVPANAQN